MACNHLPSILIHNILQCLSFNLFDLIVGFNVHETCRDFVQIISFFNKMLDLRDFKRIY